MAVIVNKENDKDNNLSRRINADLREKMTESSKKGNVDPDFAEDTAYVKDYQRTSRFGWIWIVLIFLAIIAVIAVVVI